MHTTFQVLIIDSDRKRLDQLAGMVWSLAAPNLTLLVVECLSIADAISELMSARIQDRFPDVIITRHDDLETKPGFTRPHCAEELMGIIEAVSPKTCLAVFQTRPIEMREGNSFPLVLLPKGSEEALHQILLYRIAEKVHSPSGTVVQA